MPDSPRAVRREGFPRRRPHAAWSALSILALAVSLAGCSSGRSKVASLAPPSAPGAESGVPALAIDPANGDVLLCWVAGEPGEWRLWFARSTNQGRTWSSPMLVTPPGEPIELQPESPPAMVCDGRRRVGITWSTSVEDTGLSGPASDVRFARSTDGGKNWSAPVTVNDDVASGPGSHSHASLGLQPDGGLVAVWLDGRPGGERLDADLTEGIDASVHMARSTDFGVTWGANSAQWSRACAQCRVGLAVDAMGRPMAAFRKHYPGQIRDVVVGWPDGPSVRANADRWLVASPPASGPAVAFSRDATLRLAWYTGAPDLAGVWFRESLPELWDSTRAPLPVLLGDRLPIVHVGLGEAGMSGTLVACDADSNGDRALTLARIEPSGRRVAERFIVPESRGATYPHVVASPIRRPAYVAWTRFEGGLRQVGMLRWDAGR